MTGTSDIWLETAGSLGRIRLNRPRAINALTHEMIQGISVALHEFAANHEIGAVLVTGEGERGLCAGGDIRALYEHGRDGSGFGARFFRDEYRLNAHIAHYPKPYISIMDGITMGGGVGISAHGSLRIVTARTRVAMPETGIGFFPDVGGTWLLSRGPGEIGTYLGLTGEPVSGPDAIYAGLADYFVHGETLPALITSLSHLPPHAGIEAVRSVVSGFCSATTPDLAAHRTDIDQAFAHDDVESIIAALAAQDTGFARKTLEILLKKSPTSLKLTLRLLRAAAPSTSLQQCLQREYEASQQVLASDEFYEGVRAAIIDKDRNPKWHPAGLAGITTALIDAYFQHKAEPLF